MTPQINSFKGKHFFLSNFFEVPVTYRGITYQNNEAAFQAQKTVTDEARIKFSKLNPSLAKRHGRQVNLRRDWESVKENEMLNIVRAKFDQNPDLAIKLIETGDAYLEEGNTWGDKIWGTVNGKGRNLLGKILMVVRSEINEKRKKSE